MGLTCIQRWFSTCRGCNKCLAELLSSPCRFSDLRHSLQILPLKPPHAQHTPVFSAEVVGFVSVSFTPWKETMSHFPLCEDEVMYSHAQWKNSITCHCALFSHFLTHLHATSSPCSVTILEISFPLFLFSLNSNTANSVSYRDPQGRIIRFF